MQGTATPTGFVDKPFIVIYKVTMALAQALNNQIVLLDNDADFVLRGIYILTVTPFTSFTFNYAGPADWFYQTNQVQSFIFSQNSGQPFPVLPEVPYPAGGQIKLNITNTNTATGVGNNQYVIFFTGVKRFRVQQ